MKNTILMLASILFCIEAFAQVPTLPKENAGTTMANFEAIRKGNAVQVSWVAIDEQGVVTHEVQKSTNGSSFRNIGTVTAQNNGSSYVYRFLDGTPSLGNNYYRLRSTDRQGNTVYSDILKVNDGFGRTDFRVLGNPVQAGVLNLQLLNIAAGKYFISLYSSVGERVFARSLNLTDGSITQAINLPRGLGNGVYFLEFNNGDLRINRQVMLQ